MGGVAVSCGYSTCFAVSACDGLCHLSTLALKPPFYPWVTATGMEEKVMEERLMAN